MPAALHQSQLRRVRSIHREDDSQRRIKADSKGVTSKVDHRERALSRQLRSQVIAILRNGEVPRTAGQRERVNADVALMVRGAKLDDFRRLREWSAKCR